MKERERVGEEEREYEPTIPRCRTTLSAVALSLKYSELESVCEGAMTMESPV